MGARLARPGQQLGGHDWGGKIASVMGICRIRQTGHLAVGDEVSVAFLPVRQTRASLLPVSECRLVTPLIQAARGAVRSPRTRPSSRAPSRPCGSRRYCFASASTSAPRLPSEFVACSTTATALAKNSSKNAESLSRSPVTTMNGIAASPARRRQTARPGRTDTCSHRSRHHRSGSYVGSHQARR